MPGTSVIEFGLFICGDIIKKEEGVSMIPYLALQFRHWTSDFGHQTFLI
jgi:hypothetical protein